MARPLPRGPKLFQPMLATLRKDFPDDGAWGNDWVFEPKYDGIRIVALVTPSAVALLTRNGLDKARGFPEIAAALRDLAQKLDRNLVLDGEVVALDEYGEPARFQALQGRMHVVDERAVSEHVSSLPSAFIAFDLIADGDEPLIDEPWTARRRNLERVMKAVPKAHRDVLRLSTVAQDSPAEMLRDAATHGWEGIMAKRRDSRYEPGCRVKYWQKLKLENQQEFVVGGYTEPRNSRKHFGALLLGYYQDGELIYAGHTGTGFSDAALADIYRRLKQIEQKQSPFAEAPATNERAHWVAPKYVAQVRFNEWTGSGSLRHPVFLGLRDDKPARAVVREPVRVVAASRRHSQRSRKAEAPSRKKKPASGPGVKTESVVAQLRENPKANEAAIKIDAKTTLEVTSLGKVFFPGPRITKGRLFEYYAEVSPFLLPALDDRPLVLKRFPNGIAGEAFYQQKAPDVAPPGVRVEEVADSGAMQRRLIGGNLATLLYVVQLGAISTDPWHSRMQSLSHADYSIIDLDPGPRATFKRVVQVARWVKEELDELGLHGVVKTSGASGIHVALPLPSGASYEISKVLAELVARRVNQKHPKETTVVRAVKARKDDAVYVDYLQNIQGKTVASVYSARAEPEASASTPLKWSELTSDLDAREFTILTLPKRLRRVGDLWAAGMKKRNRLPGIIGKEAA